MWLKIFKIFMKKWVFPNPSRINLGWSLDHQGMKKHQFGSIGSFRNHEKHQKISKNDKLKNWPRKWTDKHVRSWSRSLLDSFGLFLFFFWFNMTLRADRLKSNYLGCWIFEISSAPDLDPFSIFFFVFLRIWPLEFDKFHLIFAFWVARGLGTLRLTRSLIYICFKVSRTEILDTYLNAKRAVIRQPGYRAEDS